MNPLVVAQSDKNYNQNI